MGLIIWIVIGGVIGWLASQIMNKDDQQEIVFDTGLGIAGSFLGGWLLAPLFGGAGIGADDFTLTSLIVAFVGAVFMLAVVNLVLRGRVR